MDREFILQFETIFKLSFYDVTNIEDMNVSSYDKTYNHFINLENKNVYSFDKNDEMWLKKNLFKGYVLQKINASYSKSLY